jgi:hypothetical protein
MITGVGCRYWGRMCVHSWVDFPYRLVNKPKGRGFFVVEPYNISLDCLESLKWHEADGWTVTI